uniref:Family with sequence similarity 234 member A n=1 Tax=Poecilia reticulata TaxID=8081 RepID=A0A3P9PVD6_POERE
METADQATEGSPLKPAGDGSEAAPAAELQKKSCKRGFCRMSHWRTAVFFLSLFLCLTVVFAFSFIIPCPERPQYKLNWSRSFSDAVTYDFLALDHANSDQVMDVLIVIRSPESSPNTSCSDEGLTSPCLFLLALDGTKGETLWERPLGGELDWAHYSGTVTSYDPVLVPGAVMWQQPRPSVLSVSLPVLSVPDLDGDRVHDVVLVLLNDTQLCPDASLSLSSRFPSFGHFNRDDVLDPVVEVEDDDVRNSTKVSPSSSSSSSSDLPPPCRPVSTPPSVLQVAILDGGTGGLLWEEQLQPGAGPLRPDASRRSARFCSLQEESGGSPCSYMLHPLYPDVLLEFSHGEERIVAFRATLMERSRHAAYFLLTGPEAGEAGGTVVLTKRKLKQDVPLCSVRHIRTSQQHSDAEVREAFYRLRFRSD